MAKINEAKERVINTMESINTPNVDSKLQAENFKKAQDISKGPRKKFKCSSVYAPLYPEGFISTYQGIIINLIFDNREVELPEVVVKYIEEKIQKKADTEAAKLQRYTTKYQEKLGNYSASE